jgi:prepilin-type processing-associated H-X9-DG protein
VPSPAKIYDRPERKGISPLFIAAALVLLLVAGYFVYRAFFHSRSPSARSNAASSMAWLDGHVRGENPWTIAMDRRS